MAKGPLLPWPDIQGLTAPKDKPERFPFDPSIIDTTWYHMANTTGEGVSTLAGQGVKASVPEGQRRSSAAAFLRAPAHPPAGNGARAGRAARRDCGPQARNGAAC